MSAQTNLVAPNFKHPTVVQYFGADKLSSEAYRQSVANHKQVAKYSDVRLGKGDVDKAIKAAFKGM